MGLAAPSNDPDEAEPKPDFRRKLARCWALLLARIYECLPLHYNGPEKRDRDKWLEVQLRVEPQTP